MNRASADFSLRYALRALRRRKALLLIGVVVVPAVAVAISVMQKKEYTATASLLFRDPQFDQKLFGASYVQNEDPTRLATTNLDMVSLPRIAALTAAHVSGMTEQQVSDATSVNADGQSDLVFIAATARSPALAVSLADTFGNQYIAFRRDSDRAVITAAEVPLQNQIARLSPALRTGSLGQSLQTRLSELKTLASLQTGDASLVQPAEVPRGPSSPKLARNVAVGLALGLLLGIAAVLLAEMLDRHLRDQDEVEEIFERPVLATLPEHSALTSIDPTALEVPETEAFRMLWANLRYFTISREIRVVLITSADRGDGKSTVCWGLAAAAADARTRTLLIEADLRKPALASRCKMFAPLGLTDVLAGDVDLSEAITEFRFPDRDSGGGPESMDLLVAGTRPPNPSDLLQSRRMADILRQVRDEYDLIVIDTPPAPAVSDVIPLITLADGVLVVTRLRTTLRDHALRLRGQLDHLDASVLGVIVNSGQGDEAYGYGYGYEDARATHPRARHSDERRYMCSQCDAAYASPAALAAHVNRQHRTAPSTVVAAPGGELKPPRDGEAPAQPTRTDAASTNGASHSSTESVSTAENGVGTQASATLSRAPWRHWRSRG